MSSAVNCGKGRRDLPAFEVGAGRANSGLHDELKGTVGRYSPRPPNGSGGGFIGTTISVVSRLSVTETCTGSGRRGPRARGSNDVGGIVNLGGTTENPGGGTEKPACGIENGDCEVKNLAGGIEDVDRREGSSGRNEVTPYSSSFVATGGTPTGIRGL